MSNDNNLIPTQAQTRWGFIEDVSIKEETNIYRDYYFTVKITTSDSEVTYIAYQQPFIFNIDTFISCMNHRAGLRRNFPQMIKMNTIKYVLLNFKKIKNE